MRAGSRPRLVELKVRLRPRQLAHLRALAAEAEASLGQVVRGLIDAGLLESGDGARRQVAVQEATLASLLAAEQALLLLKSWLPDGERRAAELAVRLDEAVRRRLAEARSLGGADV